MTTIKQSINRRGFLAGGAAIGAGLALPGCVIDRGANGVAPLEVEGGRGGARGEGVWRDMFNGQDLSGWVNVNGWNDTWRWENGMVVTTGKPICVMRTERMYENFELEMEWRHMVPGGNAGLFIWSDALPA